MKGINPILENALVFWGIKFSLMVFIYFWLIAPNLQNTDPALATFINIAYAFLTIFVIFSMDVLNVTGLFNFGKK